MNPIDRFGVRASDLIVTSNAKVSGNSLEEALLQVPIEWIE